MSIYQLDASCAGPMRSLHGRVVSGPSDSRQAAFHVSVAQAGEASYQRITDANGTCVESSIEELMTEVASRAKRSSRLPIVLVAGAIACIAVAALSFWLSLLLAVATVVLATVVRTDDLARSAIFVLFDIHDDALRLFEGVANGVAWLARSHARASSRGPVTLGSATSPVITNVVPPELGLGPMRMQFWPNGALILQAAGVWFVPYGQFKVHSSRSRTLHHGTPSPDSPRVGQQWQYQRKDGSPDRRRKYNPLLPIVETGELVIVGSEVLNESLTVSNPVAAEHFRDAFLAFSRPKAAAKPVVQADPVVLTPQLRDASSGEGLTLVVIRAEPTPQIEKRSALFSQPAAVESSAGWVPPGRSVSVHGLEIGGFVYVGRGLLGLDIRLVEPALIDPSLPITRDNSFLPAREQIGYSPSYNRLAPTVRAAFLDWLASGRKDPAAPVGFVFLFFYGIERRVFEYLDGKGADSAECVSLAREVERLLSIYRQESFVSYASSLLDLLSAREPELIAPSGDERPRTGDVLSFRTRVLLGKLVSAGATLPPGLALQWLRGAGGALRIPAARCPSEFEKLFAIRYSEQFQGGMRLQPNKTLLTVRHTPASATLRERAVKINGLPDVTALSKPVSDFQKIADLCCNELDAYSRWIAKNPQSADGLAAAGMLPFELIEVTGSEVIRKLRSFLSSRLDGLANVLIAADDLLFYWPVTNPLSVTKAEAVQLAQALEKLGFSMEPDVRFGGRPSDTGDSVVIFPRPSNAPAMASPEYAAALVLARLGVVIANADGVITADERDALHGSIADAFHLLEPERVRLDAHIEWLSHQNIGTSGLKKHIASLPADQRAKVGGYLARIAAADGRVAAEEMRALEKLYKSLGLTSDDLYRSVHSVMANDVESLAKGQPSGAGLDMGRVQAKLAQTAAVSSLLAEVFADEESAPVVPLVAEHPPMSGGPDLLDAAQTAFLRGLLARGEWPRHDVELLASEHALLVDGVLEGVNDFAFDRCGEPIWEGDDPIIINDYVLRRCLNDGL